MSLAPATTTKRPVALFVSLVLLLAAGAAAVKTPVYDALRSARPDGRQLAVSDLTLERDVFRFRFRSGTFHFLAPVEGRTVGAVFLGQGSYLLQPATEAERRHLAFVTGESTDFEVLKDDFETLVLLFVDDTFEELSLHGTLAEASVPPEAVAAVEEALKWQRKDFRTNFHLRLLQDLLNTPGMKSGVFLAFIHGKSHPPALAAVDPRGAQALAAAPLLGGEDSMLLVNHDVKGGIWYLSDRQGEITAGHRTPYKPLADALHYEITTEVDKDADVTGTTIVYFEPLVPALRVLPVNLLPDLRLESAAYRLGEEGDWSEVDFVQEDKEEDASVALIFPEPLPRPGKVAVKMGYAGEKVLGDVGEGNFVVGARTSWYPNLDVFGDMATFELTYRVPAGREVVSVGERLSSAEEDGQEVSRWRSDIPIRVAGFNLGRFDRIEKLDETSGIEVRVYSNPGTPDVIREINEAIRGSTSHVGGVAGTAGGLDLDPSTNTSSLGPEIGTINTAKMAEIALTDGLNTARVCATYFGDLPQKHVAITQQSQWNFGQSWPSLIFMPYISFLHGGLRAQLGMARANEFIDEVGYHELAHQWWGHQVGWSTYRDVWLCEGFADFSAALVVQLADGWEEYDEHWRRARDFIVQKTPGSTVHNYEAGPISLGNRIATNKSPAAYSAVIYNKGAFVLHMIRMMMRDPKDPDPDARFIAMMKDFTAAWAEKSPTTDDFKAVVERHMTPQMNATRDGKMDWFFDQWVHGTEIPRYRHDLKVEKKGKSYRIFGTVSQEEVSADFKALLPLYLEFKKGEYAQFGAVPFAGSMSRPVDVTLELPKKPRRALVNVHFEVLAKD